MHICVPQKKPVLTKIEPMFTNLTTAFTNSNFQKNLFSYHSRFVQKKYSAACIFKKKNIQKNQNIYLYLQPAPAPAGLLPDREPPPLGPRLLAHLRALGANGPVEIGVGVLGPRFWADLGKWFPILRSRWQTCRQAGETALSETRPDVLFAPPDPGAHPAKQEVQTCTPRRGGSTGQCGAVSKISSRRRACCFSDSRRLASTKRRSKKPAAGPPKIRPVVFSR